MTDLRSHLCGQKEFAWWQFRRGAGIPGCLALLTPGLSDSSTSPARCRAALSQSRMTLCSQTESLFSDGSPQFLTCHRLGKASPHFLRFWITHKRAALHATVSVQESMQKSGSMLANIFLHTFSGINLTPGTAWRWSFGNFWVISTFVTSPYADFGRKLLNVSKSVKNEF